MHGGGAKAKSHRRKATKIPRKVVLIVSHTTNKSGLLARPTNNPATQDEDAKILRHHSEY